MPENQENGDADKVRELVDAVSKLPPEMFANIAHLQDDNRTNRKLIKWVTTGVCLVSVLLIIVSVAFIGQVHNTQKIDHLTQRLNAAQTTQRAKVLCPLYGVLLASNTPAARDNAPDKEAYDHAFVVIQQGYDTLDCANVVGGPPTPPK